MVALNSTEIVTPGAGDFHVFLSNSFTATPIAAAVPEPAVIALMLAGLIGVGAARRRRRD